jgi:hypothetical protein
MFLNFFDKLESPRYTTNFDCIALFRVLSFGGYVQRVVNTDSKFSPSGSPFLYSATTPETVENNKKLCQPAGLFHEKRLSTAVVLLLQPL